MNSYSVLLQTSPFAFLPQYSPSLHSFRTQHLLICSRKSSCSLTLSSSAHNHPSTSPITSRKQFIQIAKTLETPPLKSDSQSSLSPSSFHSFFDSILSLLQTTLIRDGSGELSVVILQLLYQFSQVSKEHQNALLSWLNESQFLILWRDTFMSNMDQCSIEILCRHVYYFGMIGVNPGFDYIQNWFEVVARNGGISKINSTEWTKCNILFAFARLGVQPTSSFMSSWYNAVVNDMQSYAVHSISTVLWSHAQLNLAPTESFLTEFYSCIERNRDSLSFDILTTLLWSMACLKLQPQQFVIDIYMELSLKQKESRMKAASLVDSIWALSQLDILPDREFLNVWYAEFFRTSRYLSCDDISSILQSVSKLRLRPPQVLFFEPLFSAFGSKLTEWRSRDLANFMHCLALLQYPPGDTLLSTWYDRFEIFHFDFSTTELTCCLWAIASLRCTPTDVFLARWEDGFSAQRELFTPSQLAECFWAMARIHIVMSNLPVDEVGAQMYLKRERSLQSRFDDHWMERADRSNSAMKVDPSRRHLGRGKPPRLAGMPNRDAVLELLDQCSIYKERFAELVRSYTRYFMMRWEQNADREMSSLNASQLANVLWALAELSKHGIVQDWNNVDKRERSRQVWLDSLGPSLVESGPKTLRVIIEAMQELGWDPDIHPLLNEVQVAVSVREQLRKQALQQAMKEAELAIRAAAERAENEENAGTYQRQ